MKYYFLSYQQKNSCDENWSFGQRVIDIHPLEWLKQTFKLPNEQIIIIFYKEIDVEEFVAYNELFKG